jgi:hypothetical protein
MQRPHRLITSCRFCTRLPNIVQAASFSPFNAGSGGTSLLQISREGHQGEYAAQSHGRQALLEAMERVEGNARCLTVNGPVRTKTEFVVGSNAFVHVSLQQQSALRNFNSYPTSISAPVPCQLARL